MMNIIGRPVHADDQGVTHFAYGWSDACFDVLCEVKSLYLPRSSDEPPGSTPTCVRCWHMVLNEHAKAIGET